MSRPRFELWRLTAAVSCFAGAFWIGRFALVETKQFGGGLLPSLCVIATVALVAGGIGYLSKTAARFMIAVGLLLLRILAILW